MDELEKLARQHGTGGWQTLDDMLKFGRAVQSAERERCAKPVPDEWLVKVRRLVQGFEHVSGIARLWEPDYSSSSERALWSRATEACADVAKLLREAEGPNTGDEGAAAGGRLD